MSIRESGKASSSLGLQDFDLLRVIGRGSYAKVLLVRLKKTERIYAMKVVKKELVNDDEVSKLFINKSGNFSKEVPCLPLGGSQASGSATLIENYTCGFLYILYCRRFARHITNFEFFIDRLIAQSRPPVPVVSVMSLVASVVSVSFCDRHCLQQCPCRIQVNKPGLLSYFETAFHISPIMLACWAEK